MNLEFRSLISASSCENGDADFPDYEGGVNVLDYLNQILNDPELCKKVMKDELNEVKETMISGLTVQSACSFCTSIAARITAFVCILAIEG